ncbi:MAG: RQC domain protein [Ignavibacteriae bacterium]|nr:RQC domain protein [Ignavibacteriota bacterium]
MSRRIQRSPVYLHPERTKQLPFAEIKTILRGADELIGRGGRGLLARILKGSREKSVLEHGLDQSPVYGHFHDLTIDEITSKIDWLIDHCYLDYEYSGKLPLLCYSPLGWEIERETYAEELFDRLCLMASSGERGFDMTFLKDRNREMILLLLAKLEQRADASFLPLLESWKNIDYKKVRQRIDAVMRKIASRANPPIQ